MKKLSAIVLTLFGLSMPAKAVVYPIFQSVALTTSTATTPPLQTGTMNITSGTIRALNVPGQGAFSTVTATGTIIATGDITGAIFHGDGSVLTGISLGSGSTSYIQNRATLQSGATFYVSSGTVTGNFTVGPIIFTAGNGIVGSTAGGTVPASVVGASISSTSIRSAAVGITGGSGAVNNVVSLLITTGTWIVYSQAAITASGATLTSWGSGLSTSSGAIPGTDTIAAPDATGQVRFLTTEAAVTSLNELVMPPLISRVTVTSNTTYYLVEQVSFSVATPSIYGSIFAIRIY